MLRTMVVAVTKSKGIGVLCPFVVDTVRLNYHYAGVFGQHGTCAEDS